MSNITERRFKKKKQRIYFHWLQAQRYLCKLKVKT